MLDSALFELLDEQVYHFASDLNCFNVLLIRLSYQTLLEKLFSLLFGLMPHSPSVLLDSRFHTQPGSVEDEVGFDSIELQGA